MHSLKYKYEKLKISVLSSSLTDIVERAQYIILFPWPHSIHRKPELLGFFVLITQEKLYGVY